MNWGKRREAPTRGQAVELGSDLATLEPPTDTFFDTPADPPTEETADTTIRGTTWTTTETTETTETTTGTIGPTLCLQGELTGDEDVTIDGKVEGRIEVQNHTVTIGPNADIKATVVARCVVIQGKVVGDITAEEKVEIAATGSLIGDINASRVVLAESARFKGKIDMGWDEHTPATTTTTATTTATTEKTTTRPAREAVLGALEWDRPTTKTATEPKPHEARPHERSHEKTTEPAATKD